jgi:hypothetical protein
VYCVINSVLVICVFFVSGCGDMGKPEIPGYGVNNNMDDSLMICAYVIPGEIEDKAILRSCCVSDLNNYDDIAEIKKSIVSTSDDGTKILCTFVDNDDSEYSEYIGFLLKENGGWSTEEVDVEFPEGNNAWGMYKRIPFTCSYAISPDGEWGLLTYYEGIMERVDSDGTFGRPETTFYKMYSSSGGSEVIPDIGYGSSLVVYTITKNDVMMINDIDVILQGFPDSMYTDIFSIGLPLEDGEVEYIGYYRRLHGRYQYLTYTDDHQLRALFSSEEGTVYKSYTEGSEKISEVFSTDIQFMTSCSDRNGEKVCGISETEEPGKYTIYYIDTIEKEYAKYPLVMDEDEIERIHLISLHPLEKD